MDAFKNAHAKVERVFIFSVRTKEQILNTDVIKIALLWRTIWYLSIYYYIDSEFLCESTLFIIYTIFFQIYQMYSFLWTNIVQYGNAYNLIYSNDFEKLSDFEKRKLTSKSAIDERSSCALSTPDEGHPGGGGSGPEGGAWAGAGAPGSECRRAESSRTGSCHPLSPRPQPSPLSGALEPEGVRPPEPEAGWIMYARAFRCELSISILQM